MKHIISNWKTSLTGLGTILGGIVLIGNSHLIEGVTAIISGIGQILGKDGSNTGE